MTRSSSDKIVLVSHFTVPLSLPDTLSICRDRDATTIVDNIHLLTNVINMVIIILIIIWTWFAFFFFQRGKLKVLTVTEENLKSNKLSWINAWDIVLRRVPPGWNHSFISDCCTKSLFPSLCHSHILRGKTTRQIQRVQVKRILWT